jgi:hypothetical protein
MKNILLKLISLILLALVYVACSSDSNSPEENTPPIAGDYIIPTDNQVCAGSIVSPSEINVQFEWEPFMDNEDAVLNYTFTITNLLVNAVVITQNLNTTQTSAILERGVSYAWIVAATDSSGETVAGETWQFQTPFEAQSNYAPFPATLITPANGQTFDGSGQYDVHFSWEGNDPDPGETEELGYTLYIDTTNPPTSTLLTNFPLTSISEVLNGDVYYWKVVTHDPNGNTSETLVRQFVVD